MHITRSLTLAGLALLMLVAFSGQAFSVTVAVGSCTSLVNYATIQQAVNAVPSGSTIRICPGKYHEQVEITEKLTILGIANATSDAVVVLPPTTGMVANTVDVDDPTLPIAAQIWVHDTTGPVSISNITVDGSNNQISGCAPDLQGILFQSASGTLNHVAVRNETLGAGLGGCQSGEGIFVQTATGLASTVTIEASSVHSYNKNGITGNDAGTTLTVMGNYVQGAGVVPSGGAAQNGIQLGFGATGKIISNTVIDNIYGDITIAASADILLFDTAETSGATVTTNTLGNSQLPIALVTDTPGVGDGVSVTSNKIFGTSSFDAIDACTNGNSIKSNTIYNSAESGIHLDASCGGTGNTNIATGNTIVESFCAGVLSDSGTTGNTIAPNTYDTVLFTTASSTSKCTIPAGPMSAAVIRGTGHPAARGKFSPAR
jgi:hypothetical protein